MLSGYHLPLVNLSKITACTFDTKQYILARSNSLEIWEGKELVHTCYCPGLTFVQLIALPRQQMLAVTADCQLFHLAWSESMCHFRTLQKWTLPNAWVAHNPQVTILCSGNQFWRYDGRWQPCVWEIPQREVFEQCVWIQEEEFVCLSALRFYQFRCNGNIIQLLNFFEHTQRCSHLCSGLKQVLIGCDKQLIMTPASPYQPYTRDLPAPIQSLDVYKDMYLFGTTQQLYFLTRDGRTLFPWKRLDEPLEQLQVVDNFQKVLLRYQSGAVEMLPVSLVCQQGKLRLEEMQEEEPLYWHGVAQVQQFHASPSTVRHKFCVLTQDKMQAVELGIPVPIVDEPTKLPHAPLDVFVYTLHNAVYLLFSFEGSSLLYETPQEQDDNEELTPLSAPICTTRRTLAVAVVEPNRVLAQVHTDGVCLITYEEQSLAASMIEWTPKTRHKQIELVCAHICQQHMVLGLSSNDVLYMQYQEGKLIEMDHFDLKEVRPRLVQLLVLPAASTLSQRCWMIVVDVLSTIHIVEICGGSMHKSSSFDLGTEIHSLLVTDQECWVGTTEGDLFHASMNYDTGAWSLVTKRTLGTASVSLCAHPKGIFATVANQSTWWCSSDSFQPLLCKPFDRIYPYHTWFLGRTENVLTRFKMPKQLHGMVVQPSTHTVRTHTLFATYQSKPCMVSYDSKQCDVYVEEQPVLTYRPPASFIHTASLVVLQSKSYLCVVRDDAQVDFVAFDSTTLHHTLPSVPTCPSLVWKNMWFVAFGSTVKVLHTSTFQEVCSWQFSDAICLLTLSSSGTSLAVGLAKQGVALLQFTQKAFRLLAQSTFRSSVTHLCFLDNARTLACADNQGNLYVLQASDSDEEGTLLESVRLHWNSPLVRLQYTALTKNGPPVLLYATQSGLIGVWIPFVSRKEQRWLQHVEQCVQDLWQREQLPLSLDGFFYWSGRAFAKGAVDFLLCRQILHSSASSRVADSRHDLMVLMDLFQHRWE